MNDTCRTCEHFEPDTHRCNGGPVRHARDAQGRTRELLPVVDPAWTCNDFSRYRGSLGEEPC